jgi:hypothetical protein
VRIRGKNNQLETKTGSVTRTLNQIDVEEKRAKELAKTSERLKVLNQIEKFREERMQKELLIYEMQKM